MPSSQKIGNEIIVSSFPTYSHPLSVLPSPAVTKKYLDAFFSNHLHCVESPDLHSPEIYNSWIMLIHHFWHMNQNLLPVSCLQLLVLGHGVPRFQFKQPLLLLFGFWVLIFYCPIWALVACRLVSWCFARCSSYCWVVYGFATVQENPWFVTFGIKNTAYFV